MKIHIGLELTDRDRGRIRATIGRGGLATRKEIRIFADRVVRQAIEDAPEARVRRAPAPAATSPRRQAIADLQALPEETRCSHCSRPKSDHGKMGLTCLPRPGVPKGRRFHPKEGAL